VGAMIDPSSNHHEGLVSELEAEMGIQSVQPQWLLEILHEVRKIAKDQSEEPGQQCESAWCEEVGKPMKYVFGCA